MLKVFGSYLLIAFYVAGTIEFDEFHLLIHAEDQLHSAKQESDPCHQAIYHHNEKAKGCEHSSHITKSDKCSLCSIVSHSEVLLPNHDEGVVQQHSSKWLAVNFEITQEKQRYNLSSRAPPIC